MRSVKTTAYDQNSKIKWNFLIFKAQKRSKSGQAVQGIVQSVSESLSMKWNRRLRGLSGEALLLRLNVTVQLMKELIRFCAWELIMCGITAFEAQGPDELPATGTGFGVLFPFEMAHERYRCSSSSASS